MYWFNEICCKLTMVQATNFVRTKNVFDWIMVRFGPTLGPSFLVPQEFCLWPISGNSFSTAPTIIRFKLLITALAQISLLRPSSPLQPKTDFPEPYRFVFYLTLFAKFLFKLIFFKSVIWFLFLLLFLLP